MKETQFEKWLAHSGPWSCANNLILPTRFSDKEFKLCHILATFLDLFTAENNLILDVEGLQIKKHPCLLLYSSLLSFIQLNVPKFLNGRVCFPFFFFYPGRKRDIGLCKHFWSTDSNLSSVSLVKIGLGEFRLTRTAFSSTSVPHMFTFNSTISLEEKEERK